MKMHAALSPGYLYLLVLTLTLSCKKENERKYCWQGFEPIGFNIPGLLICDKTEAEVQAMYPQYWFYKKEERTYCWKVQLSPGKHTYLRHVPESMIEKMRSNAGYAYTKTDCNSFCIWEVRIRQKSKTTGLFSPTRGNVEIIEGRETCSQLFVGKTVTLEETADSIKYKEYHSEVQP